MSGEIYHFIAVKVVNKMSFIKDLGFTLIELLVAISIVGVVFGVIITSVAIVKKNGRDAQRQSDLRTVQSALEHYLVDQSFYPTSLDLSSGGSLTNQTGNPTNPLPPVKIYLNTIHQDPLGMNYLYLALPQGCDDKVTICLNYCLYANLENPPNPLPPTFDVCKVDASHSSYNLEVTQP